MWECQLHVARSSSFFRRGPRSRVTCDISQVFHVCNQLLSQMQHTCRPHAACGASLYNLLSPWFSQLEQAPQPSLLLRCRPVPHHLQIVESGVVTLSTSRNLLTCQTGTPGVPQCPSCRSSLLPGPDALLSGTQAWPSGLLPGPWCFSALSTFTTMPFMALPYILQVAPKGYLLTTPLIFFSLVSYIHTYNAEFSHLCEMTPTCQPVSP